jgi:hypothetical protein
MTENSGHWSIGPSQDVPGRRQDQAVARFDALHDLATSLGGHMWIATVGYDVTVPLVRGAILDADSLIIPPQVGCFICEQPYERGLEITACPGEPEEQP